MSAPARTPGGVDGAASCTVDPTEASGPGRGSRSFARPATAGPVTGRPWYRAVNWGATVWVLFLLIPLAFVLFSPMPLHQRLTGLVGVLGFIGYYTYAVSTRGGWEDLPEDAGAIMQLRGPARDLAVLALLAFLMAVSLGWWAAYTLPFFCAFILFSTHLRTGLTAMAVLCVGAVATVLLVAPDPTYRWTVVGCALSSVSISAARIAEEIRTRRAAQERELAAAHQREEIGRDVHDLLGHSLTVLTLKAEVARRLVSRDPAAAERELDEIIALSRSALADVRGTVTRLRTPDLASQVETSRTAFAAAEVAMWLHGSAASVPERHRPLLAWALREATTNVLRHAGATRVRVELATGLLRVLDDGTGLGAFTPGNGLGGLRTRVEAEGGSLSVVSPAWEDTRRGTLLEVRLP